MPNQSGNTGGSKWISTSNLKEKVIGIRIKNQRFIPKKKKRPKKKQETIDSLLVKMAEKPKRVKPQTNINYWVTNPSTEKRTYTQPWHEYNLTQCNEKIMFMDILRDLTEFIKIRKKISRERPKLNVHDLIFCMGMFVYVRKSSRRLISELQISKERGLLHKVFHFNSVLNYFNNPVSKKHLEYLLTS